MATLGVYRTDPKGAYSAEVEYSFLDWVTDSGNSYLYINQYTCPSGITYYSDAALTTAVDTTGQSYVATYVNATYCTIEISETTYYVATGDCVTGTTGTPLTDTDYWLLFAGKGADGTQIYSGSVITGTSTTPTVYATGIEYANVNDRYRNTDSGSGSYGNEYKCVTAGNAATAEWIYDGTYSYPQPSDDNPLMAGTASPGTSNEYLRKDCVPPSDTSRAKKAVVEAEYNAEATYALGEFCVYDNDFYECTTAIGTPEAWNAAHWTQRTIGYVLKVLNDGKAAAADLALLTDYNSVSDASNIFACDAESKSDKNFYFTIADTTAKTVTFSNVPAGRCTVFLEITMTATAAITWTLDGGTVNWAGGTAPSLVSGYKYRIILITNDSGTTWDGYAAIGAA